MQPNTPEGLAQVVAAAVFSCEFGDPARYSLPGSPVYARSARRTMMLPAGCLSFAITNEPARGAETAADGQRPRQRITGPAGEIRWSHPVRQRLLSTQTLAAARHQDCDSASGRCGHDQISSPNANCAQASEASRKPGIGPRRSALWLAVPAVAWAPLPGAGDQAAAPVPMPPRLRRACQASGKIQSTMPLWARTTAVNPSGMS